MQDVRFTTADARPANPEPSLSALVICGMAGYREDSEYSLGRLLRDAHGAALMINNDRINANSAQMLLIHRGE